MHLAQRCGLGRLSLWSLLVRHVLNALHWHLVHTLHRHLVHPLHGLRHLMHIVHGRLYNRRRVPLRSRHLLIVVWS